jgi:hypothetical protein
MVSMYVDGKLRDGDFHKKGGGFVESTAFVYPNCRIDPMACIIDNAKILGPLTHTQTNLDQIIFQLKQILNQILQQTIFGQVLDQFGLSLDPNQDNLTIVSGQAIISGNAVISDKDPETGMISPCYITDHAKVTDNSFVYYGATIGGYSIIKDMAQVKGVQRSNPQIAETAVQAPVEPTQIHDQSVVRSNAIANHDELLENFSSLPQDITHLWP